MTKVCSRCRIKKELNTDNFGRHKGRKDGFDCECKECKKKRDAERYSDERDSILENKKEYYLKNKKAITERQLNYYYDNQKECKQRERNWRINNPHKRRIISERRRARECNTISTLSSDEWLKTKKYFENSCAYCGITEEQHLKKYGELLHHEHFIPLMAGGGYQQDNIIPSCRNCNSSKANNSFYEWYPNSKNYDKNKEIKIIQYIDRIR